MARNGQHRLDEDLDEASGGPLGVLRLTAAGKILDVYIYIERDIYIYVCICLFICSFIQIYIYIYICIYVYVYICLSDIIVYKYIKCAT